MRNEIELQTTKPLDIASGAARQIEYEGNIYLPEKRINPTDLITSGGDDLLKEAILDPIKNATEIANNFNCIIADTRTLPEVEQAPAPAVEKNVLQKRWKLKEAQYGSAKYMRMKSSYRKVKRSTKRPSPLSRQISSQLTETTANEMDEDLGRSVRTINTADRAREAALFTSRKTVWVVRKTVHTTQHIVEAAQIIVAATKRIAAQLFAAHSAFAGIGVLAIIILVLLAALIVSIIPSISLKSDTSAMTLVYQYVTELDAKLTEEIRDLEAGDPEVKYHFYINGHETNAQGALLQTNADLILLYLDTKYPEYSLDQAIQGTFGGTTILEEVDQIHSRLYSYTTRIWTEEVESPAPETTPGSSDIPMPLALTEDSPNDTPQTITHMDIDVYYQSFESFLNGNMDTLLTEDEQEQYSLIYSAGMYAAKTELASPFKGRSFYSVLRWGWRYDAYSGSVSMHNGIDIQMPYGTEVNSVLPGTVTQRGVSSLGNYVKVSTGTRSVLYAQLSTIAVDLGSTVKIGDVIGTVGFSQESGSSSTALHLEYSTEDGPTNPGFFLTGAMYTTAPGSANSDWVCPVSYEFVSSPWGWRIHPIYDDWRLHEGIDLSAQMYTPIVAARSGTVSGASYNDSAGNYVLLNHGDGFSSNYYHMTYSVVSPGQEVAAGEIIGYVGSTGDSTGPHLHFEIRIDGESVDPSNYISFD